MGSSELKTSNDTSDNQSEEEGLSEEMSQDIGIKGGETERRQDAEDIVGPMSLKDWMWRNRQKEG